jgi:bacillithiol biosynthesis deacetylase BshB1
MTLDVLVFAAHPDDAELAMGGTIARFANDGFTVGIVDLTRGEMGTRGNEETRQKEAFEAAKILKTSIRENLLIPDGEIEISNSNITKVITLMRRYKPKIVFAPYFNDRHPDHISASRLIKHAMFVSGLEKIKTTESETKQNAYRPAKLYFYMQTYTFEPSFIVDISDFFETKMKSVLSYSTQFHNPESNEPDTFISSPEFIDYVNARAKFYGFHIGKKFGEPFYCEEKIELNLNGMLIP